MKKRWWFCGALAVKLFAFGVVALSATGGLRGVLTGALSPVWTGGGSSGAGRIQPASPADSALPTTTPSPEVKVPGSAGEEASEPPEVIDLTPMPRLPIESTEPPLADTPPPPPASKEPTVSTGPSALVPQFLEFSADGDESHKAAMPNLQSFWRQVAAFVWGIQPEAPMPESTVVPFRMPDYHRDHPSCPYTGGCPYDHGYLPQAKKQSKGD